MGSGCVQVGGDLVCAGCGGGSWWLHAVRPGGSTAPACLFGEIHGGSPDGWEGPTSLGLSVVGLWHCERAQARLGDSPSPLSA